MTKALRQTGRTTSMLREAAVHWFYVDRPVTIVGHDERQAQTLCRHFASLLAEEDNLLTGGRLRVGKTTITEFPPGDPELPERVIATFRSVENFNSLRGFDLVPLQDVFIDHYAREKQPQRPRPR